VAPVTGCVPTVADGVPTVADGVRLSRPLSLRTRLAALAAAWAVVGLGVVALLLYRNVSGELSAAITDELAIRVDNLAAGLNGGSVQGGSALVTVQAVDEHGDVLSPVGADPLLTSRELARAIRRQIIVDREVPSVGRQARLLARPIGRTDQGVVVGAAAASTAPLHRARDRLLLVLVVAGPALIAVVGAAAWLLARAALRPVRRMAAEAATISAARTERRLPQPAGDDEIAELGRTLNAMLDRIEATLGHERAFIDDAAHELRTPLAVLRGELELASHEPGDRHAVAQSLASALEEADRLTRLTEDLLTLARADAGQLTPGEAITELLGATRQEVQHLPHRDGVTIEVRGEPAIVRGEPEWVSHIVSNLVANAGRYAKSRIVVTVGSAGECGRLVVADDGPGFPAHLLPRVLDRFSRGEDARGYPGGGAGLGLAIVSSLTHAAGGTVTVGSSASLGGACVEVEIPLAGR
jgi:signal transduction histidine kinase